jgi:aspartate aminotransferase
MQLISKRGTEMPSSPIRKLVPFAEKAKKMGKKVFHLNIGQPDIRTPEHVIEKLKNLDLNVIEYSHSAGNESYRIGLANYYNTKVINNNFTSEEIIVTTGGSEALSIGMMTCLDEGDEIIIPEPFYANYNGFAKACGVNVVSVPCSIEDGFKLPPLEEFEKLITNKTKAILICNPGNPTGYLYTKEEMFDLQKIVKKHQLILFADEVYREFVYDDLVHYSALTLPEIEQNVVVVDSVSKRYSMCGVRIGCLVSKNKDIIQTAMKFAQARLSPPSLGQIAGETALSTPNEYFEEVKAEYINRRNILVEGLNKIEGVFCPNPGGAFYCVAKLPVKNAEKFCQWLLEDFDYQNETVMMAPAAGFYGTSEKGIDEVRLAYVLNTDELKRAVKCLEEALKVYPDKN